MSKIILEEIVFDAWYGDRTVLLSDWMDSTVHYDVRRLLSPCCLPDAWTKERKEKQMGD
jgi:hypothetical protein